MCSVDSSEQPLCTTNCDSTYNNNKNQKHKYGFYFEAELDCICLHTTYEYKHYFLNNSKAFQMFSLLNIYWDVQRFVVTRVVNVMIV